MTNSSIYQLFVYGSLRKGFQSPAYEYMSKFFEFVGEARVRGRLFDMGNYFAGVPTNGNHFIQGELYKIRDPKEFGWAIGQLDDYEGVSVEPDEIQLFRRDIVEVHMNNQPTHAWIYWFNGDTAGRPVIDSGDMLQYLQQKH
jgi:gamma-glutamylcyclotransferase (GGCT)/AIG2-like uncharacterized protein YtfP